LRACGERWICLWSRAFTPPSRCTKKSWHIQISRPGGSTPGSWRARVYCRKIKRLLRRNFDCEISYCLAVSKQELVRYTRWDVENVSGSDWHFLSSRCRGGAQFAGTSGLRVHLGAPNCHRRFAGFDDKNVGPVLVHFRFTALIAKRGATAVIPKIFQFPGRCD